MSDYHTLRRMEKVSAEFLNGDPLPSCACGESEPNTLKRCERCRDFVCEACRIYSELCDVYVCGLCVGPGDRNPQGASDYE